MKAGLNNGVAAYLTDRPATHITVQPGYRVSAGDHFSYHCTEVRVEAKLRLPHTRNSSKLSTALIDMTQASTDKRKQSLPDSRLLTEAKAGGIDLVILDAAPHSDSHTVIRGRSCSRVRARRPKSGSDRRVI